MPVAKFLRTKEPPKFPRTISFPTITIKKLDRFAEPRGWAFTGKSPWPCRYFSISAFPFLRWTPLQVKKQTFFNFACLHYCFLVSWKCRCFMKGSFLLAPSSKPSDRGSYWISFPGLSLLPWGEREGGGRVGEKIRLTKRLLGRLHLLYKCYIGYFLRL